MLRFKKYFVVLSISSVAIMINLSGILVIHRGRQLVNLSYMDLIFGKEKEHIHKFNPIPISYKYKEQEEVLLYPAARHRRRPRWIKSNITVGYVVERPKDSKSIYIVAPSQEEAARMFWSFISICSKLDDALINLQEKLVARSGKFHP